MIKSATLLVKTFVQPLWGAFADLHSPTFAYKVSMALSGTLLALLYAVASVDRLYLVLAIRLLRSACSGGGGADNIVLRLVKKTNEGYGKQRLWGSVAWGGLSFLVGWFIDWTGQLDFIFWYTFLLLAVSFVVVRKVESYYLLLAGIYLRSRLYISFYLMHTPVLSFRHFFSFPCKGRDVFEPFFRIVIGCEHQE
jgi:hypothetical protein